MTKCDFCPCSTLTKDGKLICTCRAAWRCEEAIEKMVEAFKRIPYENIEMLKRDARGNNEV